MTVQLVNGLAASARNHLFPERKRVSLSIFPDRSCCSNPGLFSTCRGDLRCRSAGRAGSALALSGDQMNHLSLGGDQSI